MKVKNKLAQVAAEIDKRVEDKAKQDNYSLDPLTILSIIYVLIKIIQVLIDTYTGTKQIIESTKNIGWIKKWYLWSIIKREVKDKRQAKYLYSAILDVNKELTDRDKQQLIMSYKRGVKNVGKS